MTSKVLVAGATGTQGGSVVDHLLSGAFGEYDVYGLTRDAGSEAARALESRGVTILEGDLTDGDRMREVCAGMDAVFCVTTFFEAGTDAEVEQGITLAEAAADAGVERFVFSSVGRADEAPLAHFESKARIEERILELGLDHTIVRPVFFMQNLAFVHADEIAGGTLTMPLSGDTPLALVDASDIGKTVAMALADPERFSGETVELAGDNLTPEALAAALSAAVGHEVVHVRPDRDDYRAERGDELADIYAWFEDVGYGATPTADAESYGIDPTDVETFLAMDETFRSLRPAA